METTIEIRGPGSCINNELHVVVAALRAYGYAVEVENDDPPAHDGAEMERHVGSLRDQPGGRDWKVRIRMCHEPWGG